MGVATGYGCKEVYRFPPTTNLGIHTGGEDLGYPLQKHFPPKNPFSIDIIWHNYNKIHLFYNIITTKYVYFSV